MEIPRHWRLQKQRYGLVGTKFPCGHLAFPSRAVCPECGNDGVLTVESFDEIKADLTEVPFIAQAVLAEGV